MADATTPERLLEGFKDAAEAAGWAIEWNWRDTDEDNGESYDLYLCPKEAETDA